MKNAIIENLNYAHEHGTRPRRDRRLDLAGLSRQWTLKPSLMADALLVLNAGSSSLKFSVFSTTIRPRALACDGQVDGLVDAGRASSLRGGRRRRRASTSGRPGRTLGHAAAIDYLFGWGRDGVLGDIASSPSAIASSTAACASRSPC